MDYYNIRILKVKQAIKNAKYVIIGAGSGLSTAAGLEYSGEKFQMDFKDYIKKYKFKDLYSASFYDFKTQEEKWAFWARLININRFNEESLTIYKDLKEIFSDKNYFIITTNVDNQFEKAKFEKEKIFEVQGNYGYLQCEYGCHNKLYYNEQIIKEMLAKTNDCKIPTNLIPRCPVCGENMDINLRKDENFIQDENWYKQAKNYSDFIDKVDGYNTVFLEIGVGFNTPGIIRFPFENMVYNNPKSRFIRINKEFPLARKEIMHRTISFDENTNKIIDDLKGV